jgi:integral membrane protein
MIANNLKTQLGRLKLVAAAEGWSFLILLFVAMPLKYWLGQPEAVRVVGMAHGLLFVLYILLVLQVKIELNWSFRKMLLAFIAAFVPFGTFYANRYWFNADKN